MRTRERTDRHNETNNSPFRKFANGPNNMILRRQCVTHLLINQLLLRDQCGTHS